MYYLELHFINGQKVRLPQPYVLWLEANRAAIEMTCTQYTVTIVND